MRQPLRQGGWAWPPGLPRTRPPAADRDWGRPPRALAEALDTGPLLGLSFSRLNLALLTVGLRGSAGLWHRVAPGDLPRVGQGFQPPPFSAHLLCAGACVVAALSSLQHVTLLPTVCA